MQSANRSLGAMGCNFMSLQLETPDVAHILKYGRYFPSPFSVLNACTFSFLLCALKWYSCFLVCVVHCLFLLFFKRAFDPLSGYHAYSVQRSGVWYHLLLTDSVKGISFSEQLSLIGSFLHHQYFHSLTPKKKSFELTGGFWPRNAKKARKGSYCTT